MMRCEKRVPSREQMRQDCKELEESPHTRSTGEVLRHAPPCALQNAAQDALQNAARDASQEAKEKDRS